MGRNRKPLDMQLGNLTVEEQEKRRLEENMVTTKNDQLQNPPTWLINAIAKKEWARIIEEIKEIGMINNLDYNNLGAYCNSFAHYIALTKIIKSEGYTMERETRTGVIVVANPNILIQKGYTEEMRKFAALCGLTIDARLKAAAVKVDDADKAVEEQFGDI